MSEAIDLRCGRWQDVLADVECDALICDPPYSVKTHQGYRSHDDMLEAQRAQLARNRSNGAVFRNGEPVHGRPAYGSVAYDPIDAKATRAFAESWAPRTHSWAVLFGDHLTWRMWQEAWEAVGWYTFAPVGWVRTGGTPRFQGDGPSNAIEWIAIARPRRKTVVGSLPGFYMHDVEKGNAVGKIVTGGKPLTLMRWLVCHYSARGETIADPFAGGATTLLAAAIEGRCAVGSEMDPVTYAKAQARLAKGYTPATLFASLDGEQEKLGL